MRGQKMHLRSGREKRATSQNRNKCKYLPVTHDNNTTTHQATNVSFTLDTKGANKQALTCFNRKSDQSWARQKRSIRNCAIKVDSLLSKFVSNAHLNHNQSNIRIIDENKRKHTNKGTLFNKQIRFQIITLVSLACCFYHATPCYSFGNSEYNNNPRFVEFNYPSQQPSYLTPVNARYQSYNTESNYQPNYRAHYRRQITNNQNNDPLMEYMSSMVGSLSQDQPNTSLPQGNNAAQTWTSIFTNPFGSSLKPTSGNPNNNGGNNVLDNHIKKILVPRVSGTPGNVEVRRYISDVLTKNNYIIELDEFTSSTPIGQVKFANIIASSNPNACRQLVLACHYDSKLMDGFLGAIDSAVPCAMLLKMAETFNQSFRPPTGDESSSSNNANNLGLRFIFFDGEEAFEQWSSTDSLYGSRHLASKWAKQSAPAECGASKTELDRIELFVLLDLIGARDTMFVMYNQDSRSHYQGLQRYEKEYLLSNGASQAQAKASASFRSRLLPLDFVEDDHVPFKKRGVPILLLLSHPFPKVWHTIQDNYEAIDFPKTRRILHSLERFVANYSKV